MTEILTSEEIALLEKADDIMFNLDKAKTKEESQEQILKAGKYLHQLGMVKENASISEICDVYNANLRKRIRKAIKE